MADQTVTLRLVGDAKGLRAEVLAVKRDFDGLGATATQSGHQVSAGMERASRATQTLGRDSLSAGALLKRMFAGFSSALVVRELARSADAASNMAAKIGLVSSSQAQAARAQRELFEIAQRTAAPLESTVSLYTRMASSLRDIGAGSKETLALTETINRAFAVSGATAQETASATLQLSQAFASGVLRGEEFNAVNEAAPRLMQALADSLGVPRGALRQLAEEGRITSDVLREALGGEQAARIAAEFDKLPNTIGRSLQRLQNAVVRAVGEFDQSTGISSAVAAGIAAIGEGVESLPAKLSAAAGVWSDVLHRMDDDAQQFFADFSESADLFAINAGEFFGRVGDELLILPQSIATMVTIAIGELDKLRISGVEKFDLLVVGVKAVWLSIEESATELGTKVQLIFARAIDAVIRRYAELVSDVAGLAAAVGMDETATDLNNFVQQLQAAAQVEAVIQAQAEASRQAFDARRSALVAEIATIKQHAATQRDAADDAIMASLEEREAALRSLDAREALTAAEEEANAVKPRSISLTKEQIAAMADYTKALGKLQDITDDLRGNLGGPLAKVEADHVKKLREIAAAGAAAIEASRKLGTAKRDEEVVQRLVTDAITAQTEATERSIRAAAVAAFELANRPSLIDEATQSLRDEIVTMQQSNEARAIQAALITASNRALDEFGQGLRDSMTLTDAETAAIESQTRALYRQGEATAASRAAAEDYQRTWMQAVGSVSDAIANFVVGNIKSFKDFGEALVDIVKRAVAEMIANFLRMRVIGPLLNGIMGSASSSVMASAVGSGSGSGGLLSMFGSGSGGNGLMSTIAGWFGAGASGAGAGPGFSGVAASGLQAGMTNLGYGAIPNYAGGAAVSGGAAAGGQGAALGGLGAAGIAAIVVIAAMVNDKLYGQGWRSHGGDLALRSGTSVHGGGSSNVGLGALGQPNAMTEGLLRRLGLSDRVSSLLTGMGIHTRLFGRKAPQFERQDTNLTFGAGGVGGNMVDHVIERGGLFRSNRRTVVNTGLGEEQRSAAEAIMEIITGAMKDAARMLKADPPDVLNSAIREVTKFDKKGKATGSEIFVDILGRTFKEADIDHATMRIAAENILATLDKSIAEAATAARPAASAEAIAKIFAPERDIGDGPGGPGRIGEPGEQVAAAVTEVQAIAERWRSSAEDLLEGANFLVLAQSQIAEGNNLLGAGGSLTAITDLVEDMQRGEESLSDTFARLLANTDLLEAALDLMGVNIDLAGAEFVQFATDIADAAGGLDAASALWNDYFARFYDTTERGTAALDAANQARDAALQNIGLDASITKEQFRAAFEAALPTLTPEQVVQWLQAAAAIGAAEDAQAGYNAVLAQAAQPMLDYQAAVRGIAEEIAQSKLTEFQSEIREIDRWTTDAIAALNALARNAGMAGAAEEDLAAVHELAAIKAAAAMAKLRARAADLIEQLYGSNLDQVNEQIEALEASSSSMYQSQVDGLGAVDDAARSTYEAQVSAQQRIREWLDNLLLSPLGGLRPRDALAEGQTQFDALFQRAMAGDTDAMAALPALADELLRLGQQVYASGDPYFSLRDTIMAMLEQVAALPATAPTGTGGGGGGSVEVSASSELQALYAERDRLLAEQTAAERLALAQDLAAIIRDLVITTGDPLADIAEGLNLSMTDLIADLGINLEELTSTTAGQLADVASAMGVNLAELAGSVGVELGELADSQSLMNDALEDEISRLPAAQRDQLAPLLRSVEEAAALGDTAGVEAGVTALEAAVNSLAPQLRDQLAPYFEGVQPVDYSQLDALSFIDLSTAASATTLAEHTGILSRIADNLHAANSAAGLPAYASGTTYVPRTGPALIHEGEMILPAPVARFLRQGGGAGGSDRLIAVLQDEHRRDREDNQRTGQQLLARIAQLEGAIASGATKQAAATDRQTDAMKARR